MTATLAPHYPNELTRRNQWLAARYGNLRDNGKREKIPLNYRTNRRCDVTETRYYASFSAIHKHVTSGKADLLGSP